MSSEALAAAFAAGDPRALAVARARAATLFARLLRHGLEIPTLDHARSLDELAPHVGQWMAPGGLDRDAAAAAHQRVFGYEVPPLASVVLDDSGQAGAEVTEQAHEALAAAGVPVDPSRESADHLAVLLDGLAFLAAAEAEAWLDDQQARARSAAAHATELARAHGQRFWPALAEAVAREEEPFSAALLELVGALLDDLAGAPPPGAPGAGPTLPELLDDPATGLAQIAEHLQVAARCGLVLSRGAIARAGRRVALPTGFGTRQDRLLTLLRSGAEHERWAESVDALAEPAWAARDFYRARGLPAARLEATLEGLARLRDAPARAEEAQTK